MRAEVAELGVRKSEDYPRYGVSNQIGKCCQEHAPRGVRAAAEKLKEYQKLQKENLARRRQQDCGSSTQITSVIRTTFRQNQSFMG